MLLYDLKTGQWSPLVTGAGITLPFWSHDSKSIYYQDIFEAGQPIFRVAVATRKIERLMGSAQIAQSNLTGYVLSGLAPNDEPLASVIRSNSDTYALDVDLP